MEETWISPSVSRFFERTLGRFVEEPERFIPGTYCDPPRLVLIYGHSGSDMTLGVSMLEEDLDAKVEYWKCSGRPDETKKDMERLKKKTGDLLIIRNAQWLPHMPELFATSMKLQKTLGTRFDFIVAISKQVPDFAQPFWAQFDKHATILYDLPSREWRKEFFLKTWTQWSDEDRPVQLSDADLEWLVDCCNFTTPKDMRDFVQRVCRFVVDSAPEEIVTVNRFLLESRFTYNTQGAISSRSIVEEDRAKQWATMENVIGRVASMPKTLQESENYVQEQLKLKRQKLDDALLIEEPDLDNDLPMEKDK